MIDPRTCGVLASCGRWARHRGHHGGFRVVDGIPPHLPEPTVARLGRHPALSMREVEILLALMEGGGSKGVAGQLSVSDQTIKNHLTSIYRKLDVTGLIGAYRRLGWLAVNHDEAKRDHAAQTLLGQVEGALEELHALTRGEVS